MHPAMMIEIYFGNENHSINIINVILLIAKETKNDAQNLKNSIVFLEAVLKL